MLRLFLARTSRPAAALTLALASAFCLRANAATPVPAASGASGASGPSAAKPAASKPSASKPASKPATVNAAERAAAEHVAVTPAAMATPDFFSLAERYGPAVVHVIARGAGDQSEPPEQEAIDADDPFFAFFRRAPRPPSDGQPGAPRAMMGAGSGFIVSSRGLVLTTAHIVDKAEEVTVRLTDKREFKAQVVAVDPQSDVAVLQIANARNLPFVKLGDSSKMHAGEPVLSIGSPDSFQNTVTTGIVSATSRTLPDGNAFPFLQTDVAVNPDNSGGPLFNRAGEVIGIDVQLYADSGHYEGLTFAIPIEAATRFRAQLQAARKAAHAAAAAAAAAADAAPADAAANLVDATGSGAGNPHTASTFGMQVEDVSPGMAAALGLPRASGALVDTVAPGSPAAAAGVTAGDVIVQVGDTPVDRAATLAEQLAAVPPATKIPLEVIRNRQPKRAGFTNAAVETKATKAANTANVANVADTANAEKVANTANTTAKVANAANDVHAVQVPVPVPVPAPPAGTADAAALPAVAAATAVAATPAVANAAQVNDVKAVKTTMTDAAQPTIQAAIQPTPQAAIQTDTQAAAPAPRHMVDRLGLLTHALTDEEKRSTGLPLGLMVEDSTGAAAKAGVRRGDVVLTLDEMLVETEDQAADLEAKATKSMEVLIQRNHARSFVAVKLR
ncbi:trypsin-like peptidase domain-containing protein [Paraburkholderia tagetis]|uniref:Probable periplasmic serine endoprotease DegP-like n=1 Tax=Paraburkholderia tagetis TaxID=2913261 RepID=A0A9X1RM30_9BURK|nr:trypsin-like peptidase domain-containing protein [Paraburkholderia tagetis]